MVVAVSVCGTLAAVVGFFELKTRRPAPFVEATLSRLERSSTLHPDMVRNAAVVDLLLAVWGVLVLAVFLPANATHQPLFGVWEAPVAFAVVGLMWVARPVAMWAAWRRARRRPKCSTRQMATGGGIAANGFELNSACCGCSDDERRLDRLLTNTT